ncbi:hypothetical protein [Streptomyces sp. KR80]
MLRAYARRQAPGPANAAVRAAYGALPAADSAGWRARQARGAVT